MWQIVRTAAAQHFQAVMIKGHLIDMLYVTDRCNLFRQKIQNVNRDDLTLFDHSFQLVCSSDRKIFSFVHNGDPGTDLLHLLHIVGSVNDRGAIAV